MPLWAPERAPLLLFDGECGMCNGFVRWVYRRDRQELVRFAPLNGRTSLAVLGRPVAKDSMILIAGGRAYEKTDALIGLSQYFRVPWSWIGLLRFVPARIRNAVYDRIAGHRYRIWGKLDTCPAPEEGLRDRFLA